MKIIVLLLALILLTFGLEIVIFRDAKLVAALYLIAGGLLILYGLNLEKLTSVVHIAVVTMFAIPIAMMIFLGAYGSNQTADFSEDVVFVLGAGLREDEIQPTLMARLHQALLYFERNPDAMFVVCGGYGAGNTISEASAMAGFLLDNGIPSEQIILENSSTNTYENFVFGVELVSNYFSDGFRATVITNNFHIYRAGYLARDLGIDLTHFGAPTPILTWHVNFPREVLAVFNAWLR